MIALNKRKVTIILLFLFFALLVGVFVVIANILTNQNVNPGKTNAKSTQCQVLWTNPGCWKIVGVTNDTLCQNELDANTYNGQPDPYHAVYYQCSSNQGTESSPKCGAGTGLISGPNQAGTIKIGDEYCASKYLGTSLDNIKCAQVDFTFQPANPDSSAGGAAICESTTPTASCGDGVCSTGEECDWDGTNVQSNTMNCGAGGGNTGTGTTKGYWNLGGNNACNSTCKIITTTTPVNGMCGSANGTTNGMCGQTVNGSLCATGSANPSSVTLPSSGGNSSWTCNGSNGGTNANCSASCTTTPSCSDVSFYKDSTSSAVPAGGSISVQCGQSVNFSFNPGTITDLNNVRLSDSTKGSVVGTNPVAGGSFVFTANAGVAGTATVTAGNTQNGKSCGDKSVTINITCAPKYPDLIIKKTADKQSVNPSSVVTYNLKVGNIGEASTSGQITVTDNLPSGLTLTSVSGSGWSCSNTTSTITCTTSEVLAKGQFTAYDITVVTSVNSNTIAGSYVNNAKVSGGGEPTNLNTDPSESGNDSNNNDNGDKWTLTVTLAPVNGVCGNANGTTNGTCGQAPVGALCSTGNASPTNVSLPTSGGNVTWTCNGANSGTNANCSASCIKTVVTTTTTKNTTTKSTYANLPNTAVEQRENGVFVIVALSLFVVAVVIISRRYNSNEKLTLENKIDQI